MLTICPLNELQGVRHGFFTREGGVSGGLYASLNCGFGSGDDRDKVAENRQRVLNRLDLPDGDLITAYQIHSPDAVAVDSPWDPDNAPRADAMVTKQPGVVLGILTADCVPVLLADAEAGVIGAAHAGWKGALSGVLDSTVSGMVDLGADPARIAAGIGPAIAQRSYEVGPEFPTPFLDQDRINEVYFSPSPREGHWHFDLKSYVARCLALSGVKQVRILPCDTCAEEDRFFSYRRSCHRGEQDYGRCISTIYLEP